MIQSNRALTIFEVTVTIVVLTFVSLFFFRKLLSLVEFSRCREAFENIQIIERHLEGCFMATGSYDRCVDIESLAESDLNRHGAAHFTYEVTSEEKAGYSIIATRTSLDEGVPTDTVVMEKNADGSFVRSGTGAFAGVH